MPLEQMRDPNISADYSDKKFHTKKERMKKLKHRKRQNDSVLAAKTPLGFACEAMLCNFFVDFCISHNRANHITLAGDDNYIALKHVWWNDIHF